MRVRWLREALCITGALLVFAAPASAQLISPGKLAGVHAELEGIRNCTQCHTLGQRGIEPAKCLSCHEPIRDRIRRDEGLHANVSRACANCHADHRGETADIAAFNEPRFRHSLTGWALSGQHATADCRSCHTPERITDPDVRRRKARAGRLAHTFLGLPDDCASCHREENPHSRAISTACGACHSAADWNRVADFDHAQTGFRLAGAHAQADCASCHGAPGGGAARFEGIAQTCSGCHAGDSPHGRQFAGQPCSSCHGQAEWRGVPNFDHGRTGFSLAGAHVRIACASCHGSGRGATYSGVAATCASCHREDSPHGDQFGGQSCGACHGSARWDGAALFRHDRTAFPLVGAHARADCATCHTRDDAGRQRFAEVPTECQSCHEDAHDGALGADCATCHATAEWDRLASTFAEDRFDHEAQTGFALVGAHVRADCASCHTPGRARGSPSRRWRPASRFPRSRTRPARVATRTRTTAPSATTPAAQTARVATIRTPSRPPTSTASATRARRRSPSRAGISPCRAARATSRARTPRRSLPSRRRANPATRT